jgi:hypothetical protein
MLHSSLHLAIAASSCVEGIQRTWANLHHIHGGDEEFLFSLSDVLECSGLDDTVWALRAVPLYEASEAEWVGRCFAVDCVQHALQGLPTEGSVAALLADAVRVVQRLSKASAESAELVAVWRSLRLPTRVGRVGMILRAAKACVFPGGVSEAARHSAICAARAAVDGEAVARRWQAMRLREMLLTDGLRNQAPQQTSQANGALSSLRVSPARAGC